MKTTQKLMVPCVLLLILAVMFSGCAKPTEQEAEDGSEKAIDIVFAGANPSGAEPGI
jgi:PBP1b-binding outer membrane lipoprotein LpoB